MAQTAILPTMAAVAAKDRLASAFRKKGVAIALSSAILYGFYTAFMTYGMSQGVWAKWYGENSGLSAFAVMYLLSALGAATTDTCSACCAMTMAAIRGRFGDFLRCIRTTPGLVMVGAAIIGGPLASTAYVVGLQKAGSIIVPISALCPAVGAILGRFLFKQELNARMILGIAICVMASFMIGSTSIGDDVPDGLFIGLCFGFIAACCWGIEGCVCGYGTSMIDPEVAITIRQVTSGLSNMIILVPLFGMIAGIDSFGMVKQAFTDGESIRWFIIAGLSAYLTFMFWYKGTGMCGAALGMSCNGTFSFWGPFCCWLVIGEFFGLPGWTMPPIAWAAAIIMVIGIFTIALNPLDLLKKGDDGNVPPLNYAVLHYFTTVKEASLEDVMDALLVKYAKFSAFNRNSIQNALMTAEANGLIEEARFELDANKELKVYYRAHEDGAATIKKYIKISA